MHPLIVLAAPIEKFIFRAEFNNGESRRYNVRPLIDKFPVFRDLERIPGLFEQIRAEDFGHAVVWNDYLDLAAEEVWEHGEVLL